ncbi:hypothetical protein KFK09_001086 [Dendrobium nobile]|uniref:Uncharacterized protein n=1 Tax=Dendrobium nobile TaxID=94219 RepID=A0A8T3C798_DENNO|nr:hypothetical protein KFK09_001086 [Dendrobium nobile]
MASLLSSATVLSSDSLPRLLSAPPKTLTRNASSCIRATASSEPDKEKVSHAQDSTELKTSSKPAVRPKKPQYSMRKAKLLGLTTKSISAASILLELEFQLHQRLRYYT